MVFYRNVWALQIVGALWRCVGVFNGAFDRFLMVFFERIYRRFLWRNRIVKDGKKVCKMCDFFAFLRQQIR